MPNKTLKYLSYCSLCPKQKYHITRHIVLWKTKLWENAKIDLITNLNSVQSLSHVRLFATPWIAARQASLSITNSWSSLRLTSIESVMPSSHLILCCPLLLLPSIPPSIRVFYNESTLHMRWPKYWSFSFSISPFNEHPGLTSFRMECPRQPLMVGDWCPIWKLFRSSGLLFPSGLACQRNPPGRMCLTSRGSLLGVGGGLK